jgi:ferric-dicitrate binding protein FerR (iron transport regulator)
MKYSDYTLSDLVTDEDFQQWVKNPDAASDAFWQDWLVRYPEKEAYVQQARTLLSAIDFAKTPLAEIDQAGMLKNIFARIQEEPASMPLYPGDRNRWRRWMSVAAMLVGLLTTGVVYYTAFRPGRMITYTTDYGDSQTITLPDGSLVTLNAHSTLRSAAQWKPDQPREVWLDGEAFFDVQKKARATDAPVLPSNRFVVHTRDLHIEVLGTQFNVNNRRTTTRVVLNSGKISLHRSATSTTPDLIMEPSELVEYSESSRQLVKRKVNPEVYSSWVDKKLVFNETPLGEIAQLLEDNYGLKLEFGTEQLARRKFTGSVATDDPELLLTAIATSFQLKINRRDNIVQITNP